MKKAILSVLILVSQYSFATDSSGGSDVGSGGNYAKCPSSSQVVARCNVVRVEMPTLPSDDESEGPLVAPSIFNSIAICEDNRGPLLVSEQGGEQEAVYVQRVVRPGETSYTYSTADQDFTLTRTTGVRGGVSPIANLKVVMKAAGNISTTDKFNCY